MTSTVAGVLRSGKLELLEDLQGLRDGNVRVTIEEEDTDPRPSGAGVDRRAFLRLPISERRRVLQEQADKLAEHYGDGSEWREWLAGDIVASDVQPPCRSVRGSSLLAFAGTIPPEDLAAMRAVIEAEPVDADGGRRPMVSVYRSVQALVHECHGRSVKTCWIAHAKELNGLPVRRAPNRRPGEERSNPCPEWARPLIEGAFRRLGLL